jgi:hypothetical protein
LTGSVLEYVIVGSVLVALMTPFNLVLLFLCGHLLGEDIGGVRLLLLGGVVGVALFLALCGPVVLAFRRSTVSRRQVAVVVVLVLYLGFCLGLPFALVAYMAATGDWL